MCVCRWTSTSIEKCTKREWNDERLLFVSLSSSRFDAAVFIGSHRLWCCWMCQFDIYTYVPIHIYYILTSISLSQATGNLVYKHNNTQFIGCINWSENIWCLCISWCEQHKRSLFEICFDEFIDSSHENSVFCRQLTNCCPWLHVFHMETCTISSYKRNDSKNVQIFVIRCGCRLTNLWSISLCVFHHPKHCL